MPGAPVAELLAGTRSMGLWGATVVAVDDDREALDHLRTILRAHGALLVAVTTRGEALTTVLGVMPDVMRDSEQDAHRCRRECPRTNDQ